jgi:iron complex outermembrane receptor protein
MTRGQVTGRCVLLVSVAFVAVSSALAQRAPDSTATRGAENAVTQSQDAFGTSLNTERAGLYSEADVRGFSPITAGNARIDGLYFDRQVTVNFRTIRSSRVRIGITAQSYPFTAPTGVVEYSLRQLGDKRAMSAYLGMGPHDAKVLELDSQIPIDRDLSVGVGLALRRQEDIEGAEAEHRALGVLAKWTPAASMTVRPFWGRTWSDILAVPIIIPRGPSLPPEMSRKFRGQPWAETSGYAETLGVIVENDESTPWRLRLGLFQSRAHNDRSYSDLTRNVGPDGFGDRVILAQPMSDTRSPSGEARVSREWRSQHWSHVIHASARARALRSEFDAPNTINLGRVSIEEQAPITRPDIVPRDRRTTQKIDQESFGVAYQGHWLTHGEAVLGLQKTTYKKSVFFPTGQTVSSSDDPLLVSGTAAAYLSSSLALYAGYTEGLEENGTAPENTANFPEILPAQRTRQRDAGIRWIITPDLRLILGGFELKKPYFGLDAARRFVKVGEIENQGVELSLTGKVHPDVTVVIGGAWSQPRVSVAGAQTAGTLRPVSLPSETARLSIDYRPHGGASSIDASTTFIGGRPVDAANLLSAPSYVTTDIGMRQRFRVGRVPMTARLLVANVTDEFGWKVNPGGGLQPLEGRRISVSLSADF